jgi:hypothetical protein
MGSVRVVALVTERAMRGERTLEFERVNVYSWADGRGLDGIASWLRSSERTVGGLRKL